MEFWRFLPPSVGPVVKLWDLIRLNPWKRALDSGKNGKHGINKVPAASFRPREKSHGVAYLLFSGLSNMGGIQVSSCLFAELSKTLLCPNARTAITSKGLQQKYRVSFSCIVGRAKGFQQPGFEVWGACACT